MESNLAIHQQHKEITGAEWRALFPHARRQFLFATFQQAIERMNLAIDNLHRQPIGEPELIVNLRTGDAVSFFIRQRSEPQPAYTATWGSTSIGTNSYQSTSPTYYYGIGYSEGIFHYNAAS